MVRRDFEQRFVGSVAGWVWGLIHPMVLLASWIYVFSVCLKTQLPKGQPGTYPLFLFAGQLPWLLFSETVQRSSSSLVEHAGLITKTVFPAEMVPLSVFLSSLISHLLALLLMIAAAGIWWHFPGPAVAMLPIYMLLLGLLAVGLGWIVGALQVYLRDTAQVVSVILTVWFWMTPILILESQVPKRLQGLIYLNPLARLVSAYRQVLLASVVPSWGETGLMAVYGLATFFLGGLVFRHLKRGFADVL